MTKIYLITGFLGSGKTTFLNYRLSQTDTKVGVLMNEFGKISMDTLAIKKSDMDLVELKNGSIFCSCLKDNFIKGLEKLVCMNLDEIYIESSGLADPSDMGKVIDLLKKQVGADKFVFKGTFCLVDGVFFKQELEKMVSVERQIAHSHHVLINKTDLINTEQLDEIVAIIKKIHPKVSITPISYGKVDFKDLCIEYFHIDDEDTTNTIDAKPKSIVIQFKHEPTMNQLSNFLRKMPSHFFRIKGFVQIESTWYKVDLVNEQIDIIPITVAKDGEKKLGYNELICLSSQGISSISHLAKTAEMELPMLYNIEM